jgi:phosphoglycolate phosphatase
MESIIWDWNGTLLNDIDLSIATANKLLTRRNLATITQESYRELFAFPVKDYYRAIGFDFEKEGFEKPAKEYIDIYNAEVKHCKLHTSVPDILEHFKRKGVRQFVLSAMQEDMLIATLKQQGIFNYFEGIMGLGDYYAVSKIERGKQLIAKYQINTQKATMIGDTIHDFEVAEQLNINCILVADGHQSKERLETTEVTVINNLSELKSHKRA